MYWKFVQKVEIAEVLSLKSYTEESRVLRS